MKVMVIYDTNIYHPSHTCFSTQNILLFPHFIKKSESLKLIQQIRDEAHRFAITFHRDKRSKGSLVSELEGVDGVGKVTATKLLKHFGSVRAIRESSMENLTELIGIDRAKKVRLYFDTMAN